MPLYRRWKEPVSVTTTSDTTNLTTLWALGVVVFSINDTRTTINISTMTSTKYGCYCWSLLKYYCYSNAATNFANNLDISASATTNTTATTCWAKRVLLRPIPLPPPVGRSACSQDLTIGLRLLSIFLLQPLRLLVVLQSFNLYRWYYFPGVISCLSPPRHDSRTITVSTTTSATTTSGTSATTISGTSASNNVLASVFSRTPQHIIVTLILLKPTTARAITNMLYADVWSWPLCQNMIFGIPIPYIILLLLFRLQT